jgi:hypothetical protein
MMFAVTHRHQRWPAPTSLMSDRGGRPAERQMPSLPFGRP